MKDNTKFCNSVMEMCPHMFLLNSIKWEENIFCEIQNEQWNNMKEEIGTQIEKMWHWAAKYLENINLTSYHLKADGLNLRGGTQKKPN